MNHGPLLSTTITPENLLQFSEQLLALSPVDLADLIVNKGKEERITIFKLLPKQQAVATFEYLPHKAQREILHGLSSQQVADILNALAPDDRTIFLEELPVYTMNQLLKYLLPSERALSIKLLGYPENSVGRLMTPDYLAIQLDWTVQEVLDYIRLKGHDSETVNVIYAIDDQGKLLHDFRIRQFLFASLDAKVSSLADHTFIALRVTDDRDKAIRMFRKYDRTALPVIDEERELLGIITFDDIMEVAAEEDTEDIQKIGGVQALDEPYMDTPFITLIRKRIGWLSLLFLGELLTTSAMGHFENEIAQAVVLAIFVPLIISSGGNAGSQASTLIIRAMALGEISLRDWWKVMRREVFAGIALGTTLGFLGFCRVAWWGSFSAKHTVYWPWIGITIFVTLVSVVVWGTLSGSMLPLLLKKCGLDPAVSSTPLVATLVDVAGIVIYFTTASFVLKGLLL